jgi:hypothetical protein
VAKRSPIGGYLIDGQLHFIGLWRNVGEECELCGDGGCKLGEYAEATAQIVTDEDGDPMLALGDMTGSWFHGEDRLDAYLDETRAVAVDFDDDGELAAL